ncbi:MAG TPA: GNAT family N-acetyltransferase [Jiangellaceae bacterium]|nr:GNAT family N-acetyltransferase [Jiangellaceae bacterium]
MDIRTIDVRHPGELAAWFAVYEAADQFDMPGGPWWLERELRVRHESTDFRDVTLWLAEDAGRAVGAGVAALPLKDNPRLADVEVFVRPDMRRRGIGSALLRELAEHAMAQRRTSLLTAISGEREGEPTPGIVFAEAHGFTRRMTEARRVQRPPFQLARLAELEAEAMPRAEDYRLVEWRGQVPDDWVAEYARLAGRMSTDAPLEDLEYEPEVWDTERVRDAEARRARMGRDWWCTVAVAPDGTLAGMTDISLAVDNDRSALQGDTIVDTLHRGHRLGLLLKIRNLRALLTDRPGVRAIWTWNAASNRFMIAVNEQLGYVRAGWGAMYQRD